MNYNISVDDDDDDDDDENNIDTSVRYGDFLLINLKTLCMLIIIIIFRKEK